jgi:hypothetical protein
VAFADLISDMRSAGYLDRAFPTACVDDPDGRDVAPGDILAERLGTPGLWPLAPEDWTDDLFYDLVEVFHDLIARPRFRHWHDWNQCGWHYSDYAPTSGGHSTGGRPTPCCAVAGSGSASPTADPMSAGWSRPSMTNVPNWSSAPSRPRIR